MHETFAVEIPKLLRNELHSKILISDDGFTIESPKNESPVFIHANDLIAFRYGIKAIKGYMFIIGRHYFIEVKTAKGRNIVIKFNRYYWFRKRVYLNAWVDIVNKLWDYHFVNHYLNHYDRYKNNESFELCGMNFQKDSIGWDNKYTLPYVEIGLSNYVNYFMVYNKQNKSQQKSYNYKHDWNALVLQSVLKTILKEHQVPYQPPISNKHP
jgi:hypothetical protein